MTWIGGLIAYLVLRDRNPTTARNMLVLGIIMAVVILVGTIVFLLFFLSFLHTGLPRV